MKFFILAFCLIYSFTCKAQTITHRDEVNYYVTIVREIKELEPKVQNVWGMIRNAVVTAGQNPSHKLESSGISDLRSASSSNVSDLRRSMNMISSLYEVDSSLMVKQQTVDFLSDIKSIQEIYMPGLLNVLTKGVDKVTPAETSSMKYFLSVGEGLRTRLQNLKGYFSAYKLKHNLTDEELRKFGVN